MRTSLSTYEVAAFIHDSVWQRNDVLGDGLLATSGLRRAHGNMTKTEQVVGLGNRLPGEPQYETLSKGRTGLYYFFAAEAVAHTGVVLSTGQHVIATSSGEELAERFAQSLIVREFIRLTEQL